MSAPTKTRRTRITRRKVGVSNFKEKERSIPWKEASKADIEKYTELGVVVRGSRYKAELTQKELAKKLEVLPHHISEMEHGKRPIGKKLAHKLAKALDVDYKVFL